MKQVSEHRRQMMRKYHKRYYWRHHAQVLKKRREWTRRNRVKVSAYSRRYYRKHRNHLREYTRRWYVENKSYANKKAHQYYRENRKRLRALGREWYRKNKKHQSEMNRNLKLAVKKGLGGRCVCCGEHFLEFLALDHVRGGGCKERKRRKDSEFSYREVYKALLEGTKVTKYQLLCHNCNYSKYIGRGVCAHKRRKMALVY